MANVYLVVKDGGGGDLYWTAVDAERWAQILLARDLCLTGRPFHGRTRPTLDKDRFAEWVGALTYQPEGEEEDIEWPKGCPARAGVIVRWFSTQNWVVEEIEPGLTIGGILALP